MCCRGREKGGNYHCFTIRKVFGNPSKQPYTSNLLVQRSYLGDGSAFPEWYPLMKASQWYSVAFVINPELVTFYIIGPEEEEPDHCKNEDHALYCRTGKEPCCTRCRLESYTDDSVSYRYCRKSLWNVHICRCMASYESICRFCVYEMSLKTPQWLLGDTAFSTLHIAHDPRCGCLLFLHASSVYPNRWFRYDFYERLFFGNMKVCQALLLAREC